MSIIICFIYKLDNDPKQYYGKYIEIYKEDIYSIHIGLDNIVKSVLFNVLNNFRKENNLLIIQEIKVGIISFSDNYLNYSSKNEYQCFDFYYTKNYNYNYKEAYINGNLFVLKNKEINNNNKKNDNYISSDSDDDYNISSDIEIDRYYDGDENGDGR
jgi:hypothetical protein